MFPITRDNNAAPGSGIFKIEKSEIKDSVTLTSEQLDQLLPFVQDLLCSWSNIVLSDPSLITVKDNTIVVDHPYFTGLETISWDFEKHIRSELGELVIVYDYSGGMPIIRHRPLSFWMRNNEITGNYKQYGNINDFDKMIEVLKNEYVFKNTSLIPHTVEKKKDEDNDKDCTSHVKHDVTPPPSPKKHELLYLEENEFMKIKSKGNTFALSV